MPQTETVAPADHLDIGQARELPGGAAHRGIGAAEQIDTDGPLDLAQKGRYEVGAVEIVAESGTAQQDCRNIHPNTVVEDHGTLLALDGLTEFAASKYEIVVGKKDESLKARFNHPFKEFEDRRRRRLSDLKAADR